MNMNQLENHPYPCGLLSQRQLSLADNTPGY